MEVNNVNDIIYDYVIDYTGDRNSEEFIGLMASNYFVMEQSRLFDRYHDYENMKDYLHICIKDGSSEAMFHLGNYYDEIEDYDNMIYYYEKAADLNDVESIYNLGYYYYIQKDITNMLKWFLRGEELNDVDCICELAKYYEKLDYDEIVHEYYLKAIHLKYLKAYHLYGVWLNKNKKSLQMSKIYTSAIELYLTGNYNKNIRNKIANNDNNEIIINKIAERLGVYFDDLSYYHENAVKYYLFAVERGSTAAMFNLALHYSDRNDTVNMLKYYHMGIELNDTDCMFELSIYYQNANDKENMKKYYLMALDIFEENNKTEKSLVNNGEKDFNLFMVKEILESVVVSVDDNMSEKILNKLKKINSKKDIMIFENKRKLFTRLNNIVECGICYDTSLNIDLFCGHCVCTTCYPHLYQKACPFCRL